MAEVLSCPGCRARQRIMEQLGKLVDQERKRRERLEAALLKAMRPCTCQRGQKSLFDSDTSLTSA